MSKIEKDRFDNIEHPKKRAFLHNIIETGGNISRACELTDIAQPTFYSPPWKEDEEFQAALEEAMELSVYTLIDEAKRRAVEGVEEPKYYKGDVVGHVTKYSDTLLIFLLKTVAGFKETQKLEHTGEDGGPIKSVQATITAEDLEKMRADELSKPVQGLLRDKNPYRDDG